MRMSTVLGASVCALVFPALALAVPDPARAQVSGAAPRLVCTMMSDGPARAAEDAPLLPCRPEAVLRLARDAEAATTPWTPSDRPAAAPARAAGPDDGVWAQLVIPTRYAHAAAFDSTRNRMLVFGGHDGLDRLDDVWALWLTGTPVWTELRPAGTPPSARIEHSVLYDPVRDRMVVFGGRDSAGHCNDVWALSLAGVPTWTQLAPAGAPPSAREGHTAIYDPVRDRMVVFGGIGGSSVYYDDVWAMSLAGTPAWSALSPAGAPPAAKFDHSAIYDPVRDRMVVFAGQSSGGRDSDTWALSLAGTPAWSQISPPYQTFSRYGHAAIYDPVRDRMMVFGGLDAGSSPYDVCALTLDGSPTWSVILPGDDYPISRFAPVAAYDPSHDRMVVFGGANEAGVSLNDLWVMTLADPPTWADQTPNGPTPQGRSFSSAIHDPLRDRMLVFGGAGAGFLDDVQELSLAGPPVWTALGPTGTPPSRRHGHTAIYDPVRDRMLVFGGLDQSYTYRNDVWALSLSSTPAWSMLVPEGTPPSGRSFHTAIYDPVRDRMIVFGGQRFNGQSAESWALSLSGTPTWAALVPGGTPPGERAAHSAIYDPVGDRMIVFGGSSGERLDDTWALSLAGTPAWTEMIPTGALPSAREAHTAVYDPTRHRMVVYGGSPPPGAPSALSLSGAPTWTTLAPTQEPPPQRAGHAAIHDPLRDRMVVFGGGLYRSDVWALNWGTWLGVADPAPPARLGALHAPVPNPFRDRVGVRFSIARGGRVRLDIYDVSGRHVRRLVEDACPAGTLTTEWNGLAEDGSRAGGGVYFVRLVGPGIQTTRRMILLR